MDFRFKKIFSFVAVGVLLLMSFSSIFMPVFAVGCDSNPCPTGNTCVNVGEDQYSCCDDTVCSNPRSAESSAPEICQLTTVIMNVFNMIIAAFPIVGLAILMFGAFIWATASDDPQKLETAKKTLTYGVIGLIAGLSAIIILATMESLLIADENFQIIGDDGILRVDFCLEEYEEK